MRVGRWVHLGTSLALAGSGCGNGSGNAPSLQDSGLDRSAQSADVENEVSSDAAADSPVDHSASFCPTAENDAGTCNMLVPPGPVVTSTCAPGEPPQAQGGVIEDGTYVLDSVTYYGQCPTPDVSNELWTVCGDHWDTAWVPQGSTDPDAATSSLHTNAIATVQGSTLNFTVACVPNNLVSGGMAPRGYSASPGEFTFILSVDNYVLVSHHSRQ